MTHLVPTKTNFVSFCQLRQKSIEMKRQSRFCSGMFKWFSLLILAALAGFRAEAQTPSLKAGPLKKSTIADNVFTNLTVLRIRIEIPRESMGLLRSSPGGFGQWGRRRTVKVTVKEGDSVYTNVALHLKGAAGSFRPVDDTP